MVKIFTKEIIEFMRNNVKGMLLSDFTDLINKTFNRKFTTVQIRNAKVRYKLYSELEGVGCFKVGHKTWNKGLKMSEETKSKIKATKTMFPKGNVPENTLPLGTERLDKDGYIEIKVTASKYTTAGNRGKCSTFDTKWIGKYKKLWIDTYGDCIPPKHKIIFLNHDKTDIRIENLACVSNNWHATMCKKGRYSTDAEITKTALKLTELEKKLIEIKKENGLYDAKDFESEEE